MSGICGLWAWDGGEVDLAPILAHLERRGPEGTRQWRDGPVALGHTLLATTPEALHEQLPLTDPASGCTITADVRLDNRAKLIAALDLQRETQVIGDSELILCAYLHWGEDCPAHLLGDFAFAIWDPRGPRLFCARDHMGMRQFNYCHLPDAMFAFATEDTALLAHPSVPKTIDDGKIGDFVADLECVDLTSTFFLAIKRLPPAHMMIVDRAGATQRRYWRLEPGSRLELGSDDAYAEAFLAVFTKAVRCRLRNVGGVASMLSGGLDSSAVASVGAGILAEDGIGPLPTVSAVSADPSTCAESGAIAALVATEGLKPIIVSWVDVARLSDMLKAELATSRNPFELNGTMLRTIYAVAGEHGIKVVLDGGAGDVTLTSSNRIAALLAEWRFGAAWRELRGEERIRRPTRRWTFRAGLLLPAAWVAYAPIALRSAWRRFRSSRRSLPLSPPFSRKIDFPARCLAADEQLRIDIRGDAQRRANNMIHPNLVAGRERFDQLAATFGVESRDPFMDIRLLEFCLSLPQEQLHLDGWTKVILRRALDSRVPKEIAWRRGKEHLGWAFTTGLLSIWPSWDDEMRQTSSPLRRYLSEKALRDLREKGEGEATATQLSFYALDRFLRNFGGDRTTACFGDED